MTVKIPEGTGFDGFFEKVKNIHHFMLFAKPADPKLPSQSAMKLGNLVFTVKEVQGAGTAQGLPDIIDYAQSVIKKGRHELVLVDVTPFDIGVHEQCWLVLQLDPDVNWRYSRDHIACEAKHGDDGDPQGRKGFNVSLRHVCDDLSVTLGPPGAASDCHLILFGVVHRAATNDQAGRNGHHFFNLAIEFFQDVDGVHSVLPLSIDPDVPNDGGPEFP